ncbi:GTP pyrophosphokinase [Peptostreptococcus equinus]|uniref:GTP pyrophosphokinase n=1 Tax=Peptostreptococcus equinus TaxID=3003601 RepID=A0ABY7JTF8_9FIRM|nr:GTP pyrophosphokinase [Peptostreptococcus sp. CBA3647]WAW15766.1 GTP pyrophosphokinase [Peptostreptococcus sp. CBA3647]
MSLKEYEFIDLAVSILTEKKPALQVIENELVKFFTEMPLKDNELMSVTSRIKSESSLKEKIIRNRYLADYDDPYDLISDLPDLIGLRIECKFIKEEEDIFLQIKKFFNRTDNRKFFYNRSNKNIRLYLFEKQPLKQKNGFEIYKVDGEYIFLDKKIKFELQIKSLVNVFWSEIEHKIIYKNTAFLLEDKFLRDMMTSIKNNLTMIDDQLLSIYNNFKPSNKSDTDSRLDDLRKLFAKFVYDSVTRQMEDKLSFVIDFKKPCEAILNFSMHKFKEADKNSNEYMNDQYKKISDFLKKDLEFNRPFIFEDTINLQDDFINKLSILFQEKMNTEVPWNLFFRILFELEPDSESEDFLNFLKFYKKSILSLESIYNIVDRFGEYSNVIINDMYDCIYKMILHIGKVDIFYESNVNKINKLASEGLEYVCYEFDTYYDYMEQRKIICKTMTDSLIKIWG